VQPSLAELRSQLPLLTPDEDIDQRQMDGGDDERRWRSEHQGRSEKDEDVSSEIERIARKAVVDRW
jgi:hypothetical protein